MGKHLVWWPMEGSKLGGQWTSILLSSQWKIPSLVANWKAYCLMTNGRFQAWLPLKGKRKIYFSPPFTFHLMRFYLNFFFH